MKRIILLTAVLAIATGGLALAGADLAEASEPYLIPSSRVSPDFPPAAFTARFGGTVFLSVTVQDDGSVGEVEVLDSTRQNLGFEEAATVAIQEWQFEPAMLDGQPVASETLVRIHFRAPGYDRDREAFVAADFIPTSLGGVFSSAGKLGTGSTGNTTNATDASKRIAHINLKAGRCLQNCLYDRRDYFPANPDAGVNIPQFSNF